MEKIIRRKEMYDDKRHIARAGYMAISIVFCFAAVRFLFFVWLPPVMLSSLSGVYLAGLWGY
ncbi:hypothetical protein D7X33_18250 [Butyricicoccus sp. 1XD8-22]|nr:hypothetical protein D7X33_18250 [Butyricicoccus sp. 1XD8-22]